MRFERFLTAAPVTLFKANLQPEHAQNPWEAIQADKQQGRELLNLVAIREADAFTALMAARDARAHVVINGKIVNPTKYQEFVIARAQNARTQSDAAESMPQLAASFVDLVPFKMWAHEAEQQIRDMMPERHLTAEKTMKDVAAEYLAQALEAFKNETLDYIRVRSGNLNVEYGPSDPEEFRKMVWDEPGVYVANWQMGEGKGVYLIHPLIEQAQDEGRTTAMIAPRKSHHAQYLGGPIHYETIKAAKQCGPVAVGTTNSICHLPEFEKFRTQATLLMLDEYEQTRSHNASKAVFDGTIVGRGRLTENTNNTIRSGAAQGSVLFSEAQMSEHAVNEIAKLTGKKITISRSSMPVKARKLVLHRSHEETLRAAQQLAAKGERVIINADMAHNSTKDDLSGLVDSIPAEKTLIINSKFVSDPKNAKALQNINETIEAHDLIIITPVLNTGFSITTDKIGGVFYMGSGTVLPNDFNQWLRRFRAVDTVHVSFEVSRQWHPTYAQAVLHSEAGRDLLAVTYSPAIVEHMRAEPGVEQVINQIARDNKMRENYANRVLLMAKYSGFVIERADDITLEQTDEESGRVNLHSGQLESEQRRAEAVSSSVRIGESEAKATRDKSNKTKDEEAKLENFDMRVAYRTPYITLDLLEADKNGWMRGAIRNWKAATKDRTDYMTLEDMERRRILRKLFDCMGTTPQTVTSNGSTEKSFFTKAQAEKFGEWIKAGEMKISGNTIKNRNAVRAFGKVSPGMTGHGMVKKILTEVLGMNVESPKKLEIDEELVTVYEFATSPEFDFCYSLATADVHPDEYKRGDERAVQDAQIDAEIKARGLSRPDEELQQMMDFDNSMPLSSRGEEITNSAMASLAGVVSDLGVDLASFEDTIDEMAPEIETAEKVVTGTIDWTESLAEYQRQLAAADRRDEAKRKATKKRQGKEKRKRRAKAEAKMRRAEVEKREAEDVALWKIAANG